MTDARPIVKELLLDATPEEIFPYLTQSDYYTQWMGVAVELDARPGGIFRVDPNGSGSGVIAAGLSRSARQHDSSSPGATSGPGTPCRRARPPWRSN